MVNHLQCSNCRCCLFLLVGFIPLARGLPLLTFRCWGSRCIFIYLNHCRLGSLLIFLRWFINCCFYNLYHLRLVSPPFLCWCRWGCIRVIDSFIAGFLQVTISTSSFAPSPTLCARSTFFNSHQPPLSWPSCCPFAYRR